MDVTTKEPTQKEMESQPSSSSEGLKLQIVAPTKANALHARKVTVLQREEPQTTDTVDVKNQVAQHLKEAKAALSRVNDIATAINNFAQASSDLQTMARSLVGVAEQAQRTSSPERQRKLNEEAAQLTQAMDEKAQKVSEALEPTEAEPVRQTALQRVESLVEGLRRLVPNPREAFKVAAADFSSPKGIEDVRGAAELALKRLEHLHTAIKGVQSELGTTLKNIGDVAAANFDSSQSKARDVEAMVTLAFNTSESIVSNVGAATQAHRIDANSPRIDLRELLG